MDYTGPMHAKMKELADKLVEDIFRGICPGSSKDITSCNPPKTANIGPCENCLLAVERGVCEKNGIGTDWDRLPQEVWLKIFTYLPQAELYYNVSKVCRQWRAWCEDISLWKSIDFNEMHKDLETMNKSMGQAHGCFPDTVETSCFEDILTSFQDHVTSLKMSRFVRDCTLGDDTLGFLCKCMQITMLDLGFCDDVDLQTICKSCHNIEILILEGCRSLSDAHFSSIGLLRNLRTLNISHCSLLTDMLLVHLYGLKNLRSFISDGVMHLTDLGLICFFRKQPLIEELIIDGEDLSDLPVRFAATNLPKLVVFEMSFSQSLSSSSILAFAGKYNMRSLKFRKAPDILTTSICKVFHPASCYDLTKFTITESEHMDDGALVALARACPKLESLTVDWCWTISDKSLEIVVNNCRRIKHLSLVGLFNIDGAMWLDNLEVRLPFLSLLDLSDCNQMPDDELLDLVCRKPSLNVYTYYHDKVCLPASYDSGSSSTDEDFQVEYKCPGEVGVKVDF